MTKKTAISPPEGLPEAAERWFRRMVDVYAFQDDPGGTELLVAAAWQLARMVEARAEISEKGVIVKDRFGQDRENPAIGVERAASNQFRLLCREMGISDSSDEVARIARK